MRKYLAAAALAAAILVGGNAAVALAAPASARTATCPGRTAAVCRTATACAVVCPRTAGTAAPGCVLATACGR